SRQQAPQAVLSPRLTPPAKSLMVDRTMGDGREQTIDTIIRRILEGSAFTYPADDERYAAWWHEFASWPPNVFALTSALLIESGAYRCAVSPPRAHSWLPATEDWIESIAASAQNWAGVADLPYDIGNALPDRVAEFGELLRLNRHIPTSQLASPTCWEICTSVLELHATADEASVGFGLPSDANRASIRASDYLKNDHTLAQVPREYIAVLPKLHTPQNGISIRSLSH